MAAGLALVPFLPALDGQFLNWDDNVNFLANPHYRGLGWPQIKWAFTATLMGHWIPLTWLSLSLNYALGGMSPWGYHLGNLLLHAANAALFFLLARRLLAAALHGGRQDARSHPSLDWSAAVAALLFALHPLRVESVAWITERRDVLSGFFFLLATLAYLKGVEGGGPAQGRWRGLSLAAFAAALLSKAAAMPLPLALLLLDAYPLRRTPLGWRRLVLEKLPYAALALAAAAAALYALPRGGYVTPYDQYGAAARAAMVAYSLAFYPRKFFWPAGLAPLYELPVKLNPLEGRFVGSFLAVIAVTLALWLWRRRWPAGLTAWAYSAIMVLPVSGVVHAGHQLAHDRYSYLSGLGFALVVAAGLLGILRLHDSGRVSWPVAAMARAAACLAVAALAVASWNQSYVWRDSESLWRWAVEMEPSCAVCRLNLGSSILKESPELAMARLAEGEALYREAARLRPTYSEAYFNLGVVLMMQKRYREAGDSVNALIRLGRGGALVPELLGLLYLVEGRYAEAVPPLRQAALARGDLRHANPGAPPAAPQDPGEALREALALLKDDPTILTYVGYTLVEAGRPADGIQALARAQTLNPHAASPRYWLIRAYRASGQPERAEREAQALRVISPELAAKALDMPPFGR
jgi:tetratricopeptide (TPR) repeat protein